MTFDVVIVGSGSAGDVLAARLSEAPGRRILLLEVHPDSVGRRLDHAGGAGGQHEPSIMMVAERVVPWLLEAL